MTKGIRGEEANRQSNGQTIVAKERTIGGTETSGSSIAHGVGRNASIGSVNTAASSASAAGLSKVPALPKNRGESRTDDIVIGFGVTARGKLQTGGGLFVDGVLEDADVECATFSVSRDGAFYGDAQAQRAEIAGNFDGDLTASEEIVLRSSSCVAGRLVAPYIVVHRGATVSAETTTIQRKAEASKYLYMPPPVPRRRRIKIGPVVFGVALMAALLSSGGAFALLSVG